MSTRHTLRTYGLIFAIGSAASLTGALLATAEIAFGGWAGL